MTPLQGISSTQGRLGAQWREEEQEQQIQYIAFLKLKRKSTLHQVSGKWAECFKHVESRTIYKQHHRGFYGAEHSHEKLQTLKEDARKFEFLYFFRSRMRRWRHNSASRAGLAEETTSNITCLQKLKTVRDGSADTLCQRLHAGALYRW